ncbi:LysR family transcriptional regulator [Alcaligenaceae bacterium]|nr:LysR family transcriptional regulator [Alcaligenaceae bacterium]
MELDTRLLRYFVAVAEELSFSRAATRLHISQPPLSYAIKQLENALAVQLLTRSSRQVTLTPAGTALYNEALFLLQRNADVAALVQRIDAGSHGQIKIGFVGSMLYRGLPDMLRSCKARYPDVEHVLLELNSTEQIDLIKRGGLDIGFIHENPAAAEIASIDLLVEPFSICLPDTHRLAKQSSLKLGELAGEDFIFFSRLFSPSYYETLLSLCLRAGFYPKVKNEARHWLSVASLVSQGMGVSIVPQCLARSGLSGIRFLSFEHDSRSISRLIWASSSVKQITENYVGMAKQAFKV